jgi:hypothetical protein
MRLPLFATLLLLGSSPLARADVAPVAVPDDSTSVVVSIAVSSGILAPGEFPVAGRDCDSVLSELRRKDSFAGQIRSTYEPPADDGTCFSLEGKEARVAVVCCAPRSRP